MNLEGLDHVALSVRDVERSAQWYIDVLGFERLHSGRWNGVPTFVGRENTGIALFPINRGLKPADEADGRAEILHVALRADRKNFLIAQEELRARGIRFEFQDHEICHSIYFQDLDGHQLEITTYEL